MTPVVACMCYKAMSEWHLGEIASSQVSMAEAISIAKELNDMERISRGARCGGDSRLL